MVCGTDGATYLTRCLAVCQGVGVAKEGPCRAGDSAQFDPVALSASSGAQALSAGGPQPLSDASLKIDASAMYR